MISTSFNNLWTIKNNQNLDSFTLDFITDFYKSVLYKECYISGYMLIK